MTDMTNMVNMISNPPKYKMMRIPIYASELKVIFKEPIRKNRKLLAAMLVWSKLNPFNVVSFKDLGIICDYAGWENSAKRALEYLQPLTTDQEETKGFLFQLKYYFTLTKHPRPFLRVLFAEQKDTIKPTLYIDNLDNIDVFEDYYKSTRRCGYCGAILYADTGKVKFCDTCSTIFRKIGYKKPTKEEYERLKQKYIAEGNDEISTKDES